MGQDFSYLNVYSLSLLVTVTAEDLEIILKDFEDTNNPQKSESFKYTILKPDLQSLLDKHKIRTRDAGVFIDFFHVIDDRNYGYVDLKDVLIAFSVLVAQNLRDCFEICLRFVDRKSDHLIDKIDLVHIVKTLNNSLFYFGDKHLPVEQAVDLVDSIYTTAGKIDGTIYYPNYLEHLCAHPIVELFLSIQYQGDGKDKILTEEQIEKAIYFEK